MKRILRFFGTMLCAVAAFTFTACSSDDDGPSFQVPTYEAISAKYVASDSRAEIKSLELTASGNYIVIKGHNSYSAPEKRNSILHKTYSSLKNNSIIENIFSSERIDTRANVDGNIICGKFTQIDENQYDLEGYGIVTITGTSNEAFELDITLKNGNTISVGARKEQTYEDSDATNKLCRTWNISKVGINFEIGIPGRMFRYDNMVDIDKYELLIRDYIQWTINITGANISQEEIEALVKESMKEFGNRPLSVIFTKSGSYMVEYANSTIGISTWKWEDESKGIMRYSWDIENIYNGGTAEISYSGNMLLLKEIAEVTDEENGYVERLVLTHGMIEEK